ncbi:MAG: gliding motility protein GldM [Dysgonamonadaceae bacterium]|jgi:gliding motility-associated protein GldM|nr:gliding motility protein GldM [Dysgonamonadaceae bacterium]
MAANSPNSPRQKMINLMYLVFIAMLALNVSSEVLDGFELVEESLLRSVNATSTRNELVFDNLEAFYKTNPEKTEVWYKLAGQLKAKSDSLFNYTQDLKIRIVKKADGKEGNPTSLKHPDDLNAAFEIMLDKRSQEKEAEILKREINKYRDYVTSLISDTVKKNIIKNNFNTEPSKKAQENKQTWEESLFGNMPMAAAVTLLTKMQNDVRYAEGEALSELIHNVDLRDVRVNKIEAFVIPKSQIVMRGGTFTANIVAAALDSTQRPRIFVNGRYLSDEANGVYTVGAGSVGTFPVKGYIEMVQGDGTFVKKEFSTEYFVQEQSASIEPTFMNVLYAGIPNPIKIDVSGIVSQNVFASMTNGTMVRKNNVWEATPNQIGTDAVITVTVKTNDGRTQEFAKKIYRVRRLPDPTAYIEYKDANGNPVKFQKSGRLSKSILMNTAELKAAIDDGILDTEFSVVRFDVRLTDSMGNNIQETSDGPRFSQRQKDRLRDLTRGKVVYIRGIVVKGVDNSEREISAMEITIN